MSRLLSEEILHCNENPCYNDSAHGAGGWQEPPASGLVIAAGPVRTRTDLEPTEQQGWMSAVCRCSALGSVLALGVVGLLALRGPVDPASTVDHPRPVTEHALTRPGESSPAGLPAQAADQPVATVQPADADPAGVQTQVADQPGGQTHRPPADAERSGPETPLAGLSGDPGYARPADANLPAAQTQVADRAGGRADADPAEGERYAQAPNPSSSESGPRADSPRPDLSSYTETGDLPALERRGQLRIAVLRSPPTDAAMARLLEHQRSLAATAAGELGLTPLWIPVDDATQLQQAVRQGQADLALAATPLRSERPVGLVPTLPIASTRYLVLTAAEKDAPAKLEALAGRRVGLPAGAPAWLAERLRAATGSGVDIEQLAADRGREALVAELAAGRLDALVLSDTFFDPHCAGCGKVRVAFELAPAQPLSFWVRESATELRAALDGLLEQMTPADALRTLHRDDLDGLKRRGVLRVATSVDPTGFRVVEGELEGLEVELLRRFARQHGLRLEFLLGESPERMVSWLREGRADLIAARVSQNAADRGVAQSQAYAYDPPVVLARPDSAPLRLEDMAGRRVALRRDSAHWATLQSLRSAGLEVVMEEVPAGTTDQALVQGVAEGRHDLTVVSAEAVLAVTEGRQDVRASLSLHDDRRFRWSVRGENRQLLGAVNAFFGEEYRSASLDRLTERYLADGESTTEQAQGRLSPYDELAQHYARHYGFDWRLVVAVMYEESRFDPRQRSSAGARGLMQVMPATARDLGVKDIEQPANGIQAGVAYLDYLRERFERSLTIEDRTWFALAAYHIGYARVERARREAAEMGLNPDKWTDNVELAMLDLSKTASNARAWRRTVSYVDNVRSRYGTYVQVTQRLLALSTPRPPGASPG